MRYPIHRCHKAIVSALSTELKKHNQVYKMPMALNIVPSSSWSYYMRGFQHKIGFVLEIELVSQKYISNWGSWDGDLLVPRAGVVNSDKNNRELLPGYGIVKCYIDRYNHHTVGEMLVHPSEMPPAIPSVELNVRERNIMFIFGSLKNRSEQELALSRLGVTSKELSELVQKQALQPSRNGFTITLAGMAARLDIPQNDLW